MSLNRHLETLKKEHRALDFKISHLESSKGIDYEEIKAMKLKKLHLKDEITKLQKGSS